MGKKRRWDGAVGGRRKRLKEGVWSRLPTDIQHRLLRFLPVASLCRFKLVSKDWCSAIHKSRPITADWYISASAYSLIRFYDGLSWKTLEGHLPALTPRVNVYVSSSAGLLLACEWARASGAGRCMVFNPLIPSVVKEVSRLKRPDVPDFGAHRVIFTGVQTVCDDKLGKASFAVVCVTEDRGRNQCRCIMHVYESRASVWVASRDLALRKHGYVYSSTNRHRKSMLLEDGIFYFMTWRITSEPRCVRSLLSVNIRDPELTTQTVATWERLPLGLFQNSYWPHVGANYPSLISCQGKVVLVNLTQKRDAIGFVYLDKERRKWRAMASLPVSRLPEEVQERCKDVDMAVAALVADGRSDSAKVALYFVGVAWGCIYDLGNGTWTLAFRDSGKKYGPNDFYLFQPSFLRL